MRNTVVRWWWSAVVALVVGMCVGTEAQIAVTNYCWLQLKPTNVTAIAGGSSYGPVTTFRWGDDFAWIPNWVTTGTGTVSYSAALKFDQPRQVKKLYAQWWTAAGQGVLISNCYADASMDGTNWTNIGGADFGAMMDRPNYRDNIPITPTNCLYVRVRLDPPGYTAGGANSRGGPGFFTIEPIGDGTVSSLEVNWANKDNFSTTTSNGPAFNFENNQTYNDGLFYEGNPRTGDSGAAWVAGHFCQVDLKKIRGVNTVITCWDWAYNSTNFDISYSVDGTTFVPVTGRIGPVNYSGGGALELRFDPVPARYVRISNCNGNASYNLLTQILVSGYEYVPPSGIIILLR